MCCARPRQCLHNGYPIPAADKGWEAALLVAKTYADAAGCEYRGENHFDMAVSLLVNEPTGGSKVVDWKFQRFALARNRIALRMVSAPAECRNGRRRHSRRRKPRNAGATDDGSQKANRCRECLNSELTTLKSARHSCAAAGSILPMATSCKPLKKAGVPRPMPLCLSPLSGDGHIRSIVI